MRRRNRKSVVAAEVLESRLLLSPLVVRSGNGDDTIRLTQEGQQLRIQVNGRDYVRDLADVDRIYVNAGNGDDSIILNGADLPAATLIGGNGNDNLAIVASNANNVLIGSNGNDLVSSTGAGADVLGGGRGNDTLYAIVGAPNVVLSGPGSDRLIVRDGVETHDAARPDVLIAFRGGEAPGTLRDGVLYLGIGTGGNIQIDQSGNTLLVSINGSVQQFQANQVKAIAGIGSPGDDSFVNNTSIDSIFYGADGNDNLIGGSGDDVLKGGNGNDTIRGNAGRDFLTGDAGADLVFSDIFRDFVLSDLDDLFAGFAFAS